MATKTVSFPEKAAFVGSLMALTFLYGFAARWHGWFPNDALEQASRSITQLEVVPFAPPNFVGPKVYEREGARTVDSSAVQPGLTLVTSLWKPDGDWTMGARLIDRAGHTVHEWRLDAAELFPDATHLRRHRYLHGSHLLPNGDLVVNVEYQGTVRLDACGAVEWRLLEAGHHSVERADDGSFWISGHSSEPRADTPTYPDGLPGLDDPIWQDRILHVSADGTLLETINVPDLLYTNDLERYIAKAHQPQGGTDGPTTPDLTHMNDVEPLPAALADEYPLFEAGDLLVSLRNLHLVLVVDPESRDVKWHASAPFILQHDPDFLGRGWIGVFDNNRDFTRRGTMGGGSRIVALQPHTDSMEVRMPTPKSDSFYTHSGGKWQRLDNGNMLLTEARPGRIVEVAPDGRTVWEWIQTSHDGARVATVLEGTRYDLTPSDVAAWPCSSVDASPER